jgi:LPXTG-motif cell wall-anchored protein
MNTEWVVTGLILLGGMAAGGISLYLKRRKETLISDPFEDTGIPTDLAKHEKDKK